LKKFFILCTLALSANTIIAQTLFTYGKNETSKAEFLRAYNKNKPSTTDKQKSIKEYLDLYTNFKLKVKAAEELRLDTLPQIKYDVQNFRDQVVENYMNDDKGLQVLIDEASNRASKDIRVVYFYIPVPTDAKPADTLKAFTAVNELFKTLQTGNSNYKEITADYTTKYSLTKFADAGFVTVFTLPYELENAVYNTKINTASKPIRSTKGWFIFKPIEERAAIGKWKVAQLLFAFPPNSTDATKLSFKQKADSVYKLLKAGLSFAEAAASYSDDRMSNQSGGILQEFGSGAYNTTFETNVIQLKNDNDISQPFETSFGYHIVKRISTKQIPADKTDATFLFEIKQNVTQDARVNVVKEKFITSITQKTGLKRFSNIKDEAFFAVSDSTLHAIEADKKKTNIDFAKKQIMKFEDGSIVKGNEWISYVRTSTQNGDIAPPSNKKMLDNFSKLLVGEYYKKNLEKYNTDFKYQMLEFKEGNMLFEIMERNVWSKAGTDSASLKKYYDTHLQNYKWGASADVVIFNSTDEAPIKKVQTEIANGADWNKALEKGDNKVQADSGRYEIVQLPTFTNNATLKNGITTSVVVNKTDANATFIKVIKLYDAGLQRTFAEARGLVINDYQAVLEQQWLDTLKKKYPVKINNAVLNEVIK
jgi:peptidyl-prolyl cis-trans isomerase SurA